MRKLFVVLAGVVLLAGPLVAQQAKPGPLPILGVWQAVEINITGPTPRTLTFAEPRASLMIFTAKHYSRVEVQSEIPRRPIADVSKATADELRAVWGPFVGEAGTYEVAGNVITMRPIASKNPAVMGPGIFITYTCKLEGNTIWLTPQRNQTGPFPNPFTIKAVRVE